MINDDDDQNIFFILSIKLSLGSFYCFIGYFFLLLNNEPITTDKLGMPLEYITYSS